MEGNSALPRRLNATFGAAVRPVTCKWTGLNGHAIACPMKVIAAYEAKSRFSEPLREGAAGEIFIITQTGQKKWLNFVHANLKS
jgi:hypothetical protein